MALAFLPAQLAVAATLSSDAFGAVSVYNRFSYLLSQLLIKRAFTVVILSFTLFCFAGGLAYKLFTKETLEDGAFKAYSLLNNVPGADATADETRVGRFISQVIYSKREPEIQLTSATYDGLSMFALPPRIELTR